MSALEALFQPDAPPLQRFAGDDAAWAALADRAGALPASRVCRFDGRALPHAAALFQALAGALAFPPHFGANWDALDECLHDLEWITATELILLFGHAEAMLPGDGDGLALLLALLRSAAHELQEPEMGNVCLRRAPITLRALFRAEGDGAKVLRERLGMELPVFPG